MKTTRTTRQPEPLNANEQHINETEIHQALDNARKLQQRAQRIQAAAAIAEHLASKGFLICRVDDEGVRVSLSTRKPDEIEIQLALSDCDDLAAEHVMTDWLRDDLILVTLDNGSIF